MNEGSVWGYLFAFLAVVGLAGGVHIMMETDKATEELAMVQSQLEGVDRAIRSQRTNLEQRQAAYEAKLKPDPLIAELDAVAVEQLEVEAGIAALIAQDASIRQQITSLQAQALSSASGAEFGDLAISESKILRGAKIQKIENEVASISHSDGVTKIAFGALPQRVKNRLLVGITMEPALRRMGSPDSVHATAKSAPTDQTPDFAVKRDTPEWKKYKTDLAAYEARALNANLARQALQNEYSAIQREMSSALSSSALAGSSPSRRYYNRVKSDAYQAQLNALRRRIDAAALEESRITALKPKAPDAN